MIENPQFEPLAQNSPLSEHDRRFNALPLYAQMYLGLGKTLIRPELTEEVKRELRGEQCNIFNRMTPDEKLAMALFVDWGRNVGSRKQHEPLFPFESY